MHEADYEKLLDQYKAGKCTEEEIAFIESWYLVYQEGTLHEDLSLAERTADLTMVGAGLGLEYPEPKKVRLWPRLAAAAAIFIVVGAGLYSYMDKNSPAAPVYANDIPSKGQKTATLTLASGEKIQLSDAKVGLLADQSGIEISKTKDGQLIYEIKDQANAAANKWNTLSTAKSQTYGIQLPDGTKVWLNAASVLKYPASFAKLKNRAVELTGEAYFEVAKDPRHPFVVKTATQEVEVLGTHFNINSYTDENSTRTTLLEGAVKVSLVNGILSKVIKPGEEVLNIQQQLQVRPANLKDAVAWKTGYFRFNNESLESIMRQVSRWYDVDVVYSGNRNELAALTFWGIVSKEKNVSEVLKMIERAEQVKFSINGRTITVMSN
ncbi:FecR domain-containing protein [Pedobacter gandavensis]|uniref:FecR family protein n=1 Tax=Pedobacter TaxID=84567 RepID=UPI001C998FFB|nr:MULTISPECIES: FecR family protein [Pedobacter]WGQ11178.1 FecR domain-containing protein [Pedobacter gandavensis]